MTFAQIALVLFFVLLFGAMWAVAFADGRPTQVRRRFKGGAGRDSDDALTGSRR